MSGYEQYCELTGEHCSLIRRTARPTTREASQRPKDDIIFTLRVRWHSASGKCRTNVLNLRHLDSLRDLEGLAKSLIAKAFPSDEERPQHLSSEEFEMFSPEEECLSLPADIDTTDVKLVACFDGWEYIVHESVEAPEISDSIIKVMIVEFESTAMLLGYMGVRISLIAYPIVSISRAFLENLRIQLRSNPNFKGILS